MPPTPDRTTILAATAELTSKLRTNLVADPPTAEKPFRRVAAGAGGYQEYVRPFLTLTLVAARPLGITQGDKLIQVAMTLRVVTDVCLEDPHGVMLDTIAALEDYFDAVMEEGIIEGAEGFDDRQWSFEYPKATAGTRVAAATATQSFVVKVQRGYNRVAAS